MSNRQLAEEVHNLTITNFKKRKVYASFIDNIWSVNLGNMQIISKFNNRIGFLLCFIDIFCHYAWVIPLKDKKGTTITDAFQKILNKSNCKPNKIWLGKDGEFYTRSMKSWLEKNEIEMYLIHNEGESVVGERTIKNKIYKYMASVSKSEHIEKLDDIVNKYNNTHHRTIKMKPVDVKPSIYINFIKESIKEGPKLKVGYNIKKFLQKDMFQIDLKKFL